MKKYLILLFLFIGYYSHAQPVEKKDSLLQVLENEQLNDQERTETLLELAISFHYTDPSQAEQYSQKALALAEIIPDPLLMVRSYINLGYSRSNQGSFEDAIAYYLKADSISREIDYFNGQCGALNSIGMCYYSLGNINKSMEYVIGSLRIAEAHLDEQATLKPLVNLGLVYDYMEEYELAIQYDRRAEALAQKYHITRTIITTNHNIGNIFRSLHEYDSALFHFEKSLALSLTSDDRYGAASTYSVIGLMHMDNDHPVQARNYFDKSFEIRKKLNDNEGQTSIYTYKGNLLLITHEYDSSLFYLNQGLELARQLGLLDHQRRILELLSDVNAAMGNADKALTYYKEFVLIKDSILNEEKAKQFNELQTQYETEQKEVKINLQQAELQQQRTNIKLILLGSAVFLLLIFLAFQRYRQNQKIKLIEAQKIRELDRIKSNFFANLSHEFRTPLTLIIGSLSKLMKNNELSPQQLAQDYNIMRNNSQRLLQLINQLLELSRLDEGKARLHVKKLDLISFLRRLFVSFASFAEQKVITLYFNGSNLHTPTSNLGLFIYLDTDKMEKVFYNLYSNAVKFTPEGGKIETFVSVSENGNQVEVMVSNTGPGIPAGKLPYVFDRFYQADSHSTRKYEGTGIGLALVKELLELHQGTVNVSSVEHEQTTFTVTLLLGKSHLQPDDFIHEKYDEAYETDGMDEQGVIPGNGDTEIHKPTTEDVLEGTYILIVEDHAELRQYIKATLSSTYRVLEAGNGKKGLDMAIDHIPDLIISDVMMPEMDGFELLQALKKNEKTNHIPVIMLTAKAAIEDKLEGLHSGADDYLIKPFLSEELQARVSNLIRLRKELREKFSREMYLKPKYITVPSVQEVFLSNLMKTLEAKTPDENFGVEELSREIGMSRAQTHRKITALTNQTPSELIRNFRLERAADLIRQDTGNMAQIAYQVGFNSQAQFNRSFQDYFACTPSEYKKNMQLEI